MPEPRNDRRRTYSAEEVRQGRTALRTPFQRTVFVLGLIAFVVLALLAAFFWF